MKNLAKAVLEVMKDVDGIEKNSTIGSGNYSYQGVNDSDVKKIIGESMSNHGLCLLPIDVESKTRVDRWEETYQGNSKQKQSIFTEVKTKYLLLHESGESQELCGYGHGVDSQDKSAGKATTYALKYTLLYAFLTPTGKIDDADTTHSNDAIVPVKKPNNSSNNDKPWLNKMDKEKKNFTKEWLNVVDGINKRTITSVSDVRKHYKISKELETDLQNTINLTPAA